MRRGTPGHYAAARRGETLKGTRPYGRSHSVGSVGPGERDLSRKLGWVGSVKWRLGVWVSSVKESKPRTEDLHIYASDMKGLFERKP